MALCCTCGGDVAPDENFCGNCGTLQTRDDSPIASALDAPVRRTGDVSVPGYSEKLGDTTWKEPEKPARRTGEIDAAPESSEFSSLTSRVDETPEKKSRPKALATGKILNSRYEIVRRIGGGGMGAVYLAKDRNLGDAPRAIKEMIESHLDPTLHEKAIGDFKRESLLLTSLEHPSIPTIYDYFYDESLGRFYLVMKFISGGDLASRLRNAPGNKIDEKTVTDWAMQTADVL